MTKLIVLSILLALVNFGCNNADFCGKMPSKKQIDSYRKLAPREYGINPRINGIPDANVLFQLMIELYNEADLSRDAHIPIAFTYHKNDTTILRISDLKRSDLKMAKRISCVVFDNAFIKECSLAFLEIEINGKEYLFVNHGE